jgi:hypothetical protein
MELFAELSLSKVIILRQGIGSVPIQNLSLGFLLRMDIESSCLSLQSIQYKTAEPDRV